ncbi:MAG: HpaII family restriction endonuclease [Bacteroidota bacterium]
METQILQPKPATFIPLNNKVFGTYHLIYRINDSFKITDFESLNNKHQLFFQQIENKNQQFNLTYVDSQFVNILADLTLEVLFKNISSLHDYLLLKDKIKCVDDSNEAQFYQYKFSNFIHLLLYSEIAGTKIFNPQFSMDKVFCLKNKIGELEYFSVYEQQALITKLMKEMKLEIEPTSSSISHQHAKLCLKLYFT